MRPDRSAMSTASTSALLRLRISIRVGPAGRFCIAAAVVFAQEAPRTVLITVGRQAWP